MALASSSALATDFTYSAGTSWLTTSNWVGGKFAGTFTNATAGTTSTDVGQFVGNFTVSGVGINFNTVNTAGGPFQVGAIVSNITALGNSATTLSIGNNYTTAAVTGVLQLNGASVAVNGTTTLDNVIAASVDGATKGLSFINQSVGTNANAVLTYNLGTTAAKVYATDNTNIGFYSKITESAASSISKYGNGTMTLGSSSFSSTHAFSGGLNVYAGLVSFYTKNNLGTGTVTLNGGGLSLTQNGGSTAFTQGVAIGSNGGTLTFGTTSATGMTMGSALTGSGRLYVTGNSGIAANTVQYVSSAGNASSSRISTTVTNATLRSLYTSVFGTQSGFAADALVLDNGVVSYTSGNVNYTTASANGTNGITLLGGGGTLGNSVATTTLTYNAAISGVGNLTLNGVGYEKFTATNTYSGTTTVSSGYLYDNGTHNNAGSYTVASGATYGGTGTVNLASGGAVNVAGTITGGSTSVDTSGTNYVYSQTVGTLTVNGDLNLTSGGTAGTFSADATTTSIDKLAVSGALNLAGGNLVVNGSLPTDGTALILATYGSLSGTFGNVTLPSGYAATVDYAYNGNQVALTNITSTPEPASLAALAVCGLAGLCRRRSK